MKLQNNYLVFWIKNDITCDQDDFFGCPRVPSDAAVTDFMGIMRKLTSINLKNVDKCGDLCKLFLQSVLSYSKMRKEIHIIMEAYKPLSIKSAECQRIQLNILILGSYAGYC